MLFALLIVAAIGDWLPVRWTSADPASLDLLAKTPVNCILIEPPHWSAELLKTARERSIATTAVVQSPGGIVKAAALPFDALVLEGDFDTDALAEARKIWKERPVIELPSRARMRFDGPVAGTIEGVWPGIHPDEGGATKAAPSGAPWIHTNSGFLRFVRATAPPQTPVWIANRPPANTVITAEHYMQAIADASIVGARWILTFDEDWMKRLYSRDGRVLKDWARITQELAFYESHTDWNRMRPLSRLAIVQDVDSGALFSGGVLDMIAVKHTPVLTVPSRKLTPDAMAGARMAVNVDPGALTAEQKESLRAFARSGGTTLTGPGTWKFPQVKPGQITLSDADVKTLDEIWREVNSMTGRRNLGARLFNVSSMLSNLVQSPDGKRTVLHLVNYSGYPVENVTVHLLGEYKSATLLAPGAEPRKLQPYPIEEGCGLDIDTVGTIAAVVLE
jgi:hypothetical protein